MKIIKVVAKKEFRSVTLRMREDVMKEIDKVADANKLSRQKLIERILEQVLADKNFILKI